MNLQLNWNPDALDYGDYSYSETELENLGAALAGLAADHGYTRFQTVHELRYPALYVSTDEEAINHDYDEALQYLFEAALTIASV